MVHYPTQSPFRFSFAGAFVAAVLFVFLQTGEKPVIAPNPIWWPYALAFLIGVLVAHTILPNLNNSAPEHPGPVFRFFHSAWWGWLLGLALGLGLVAVGIGFENWNFPAYLISWAVGAAIRYAVALILEKPGPKPSAGQS